jgi:hypothetical protein
MSAFLSFVEDIAAPVSGYSLKAILVDGYTQDLTDDTLSDVIAFEVSGTGYTTGGVAVTGVAISTDTGAGTVSITFDPVDYGAVDIPSITGLVLYDDTGDTLVAVDIFAAVDATAATNFTYTPHADGFVLLTVV